MRLINQSYNILIYIYIFYLYLFLFAEEMDLVADINIDDKLSLPSAIDDLAKLVDKVGLFFTRLMLIIFLILIIIFLVSQRKIYFRHVQARKLSS